MTSKYKKEPITDHERTKIVKMIENGLSWEDAEKTRFALRRKKRVEKVEERKKDAIH